MRHVTLRAGVRSAAFGPAAALVLVPFARPAQAATVLVERDSLIRITGNTGASGGYDLDDGTTDAGGFAEMIDSADWGVASPQSSAQQHSMPAVAEDGSLAGAWAEGWARAWADPATDPASASASESRFGVVFDVAEDNALFTLGGALGADGAGG